MQCFVEMQNNKDNIIANINMKAESIFIQNMCSWPRNNAEVCLHLKTRFMQQNFFQWNIEHVSVLAL